MPSRSVIQKLKVLYLLIWLLIWGWEGPNATVQGPSQGATGCGGEGRTEVGGQTLCSLSQFQAIPLRVFMAPKTPLAELTPPLHLSLSFSQVPLRAGRTIPMAPPRPTSPVRAEHQDTTPGPGTAAAAAGVTEGDPADL